MQNDNASASDEANWNYTGNQSAYSGALPEPAAIGGQAVGEIEPVEWTASEYVSHVKSSDWFMKLFGIGGAVLAVVYLATRDKLATGFVFIAIILFSILANRRPMTKSYRLDSQGLTVNGILNRYKDFRSFSVVEEGVIDSIWLKPLKKYTPMVVMYFDPKDEDLIANTLSNFLPNEPRELDIIDKITKHAKF